jgi:MFS family permease
MALYAIAILTAVQLQLVQGRSAKVTGGIMLGQPLMQACLSPLSGRLSDRVGSRLLSTAGMLLTTLGMVLLSLLGHSVSMLPIVAALAIVGVGMAAFSAPNTSAIMGSVDRSQLSVASAFLGTMRVTGQALSVAVLGGIAASHLGPGGWRLLLRAGGSPSCLRPGLPRCHGDRGRTGPPGSLGFPGQRRSWAPGQAVIPFPAFSAIN